MEITGDNLYIFAKLILIKNDYATYQENCITPYWNKPPGRKISLNQIKDWVINYDVFCINKKRAN